MNMCVCPLGFSEPYSGQQVCVRAEDRSTHGTPTDTRGVCFSCKRKTPLSDVSFIWIMCIVKRCCPGETRKKPVVIKNDVRRLVTFRGVDLMADNRDKRAYLERRCRLQEQLLQVQ